MGSDRDQEVVHRELDTNRTYPAVELAEIIADLKNTHTQDLQSTYSCIDHVLDHTLSTPPSPDAQIQITFNYEGYRITVEQNGKMKLVKSN